ncbi:MAG: LytR family transcriptional regulator, partial [Cyanobacteria bacterium J083]
LAVAKRDLILSEYFNHSDSSVQTVANRRASKGLTINIQNTTNEIGLGGRVSALLTEADYTNLKIIPTQPEMLAKSKIIIQPESLATGKALKEILGFGKLEITKFGNLDAQLTILLGEDAKQLLSKDSFLE